MKQFLIDFFTECAAVIRDIYAAAVYVWKGPELTPEQIRTYNERHAETAPAWWHGPVVKPVEVPTSHTITEQAGKGNIVGWAGDWVVDVPTKKQVETVGIDEVLTPAEVAQMKAYRLSPVQIGLNNLSLAAQIKPYWQAGKKPGEIAVLVGCSESTAKHYCTCFKRANETE
jgi:hypothetical protein